MKLKPYNKKLPVSYVLGVTTVLEILSSKPKLIYTVFLSTKIDNSLADKIIGLCKTHNVTFEFDNQTIERSAYKENTYAIAVIKKYNQNLDFNKNHLMLVNPSNMGNLGTIIRTCVAFDMKNIAIVRPACDIFDPKVISSSMGAIFNINFEYFESFDEYIDKSKSVSTREFYSFMLNGEASLKNLEFKSPFTLIFGNEGEGLDLKFKKETKSVFIPHSKEVDSLNLAVAVGIVLANLY